MKVKELVTTVKEKITTMIVVGAVSLLTFSYIAWADSRYVQHQQLSQLEMNLGLNDIAREIKDLRRRIRAAKLDKGMAEARGDEIAASRSQADILYFEDEISTLQEDRNALVSGN